MINFNFTAWIPFWPGRVDVFQQTQKAGDNTATDTELHLTGFGIPRVSRTEECLPESSCFMEKKSDGENISMHVKALNLFELQFGISINGTHCCGSRQGGSTLNRFLSWGRSQMLISVEHSILSPLRAILWLKRSASCCDLLQRRPGVIFDHLMAETRFWQ